MNPFEFLYGLMELLQTVIELGHLWRVFLPIAIGIIVIAIASTTGLNAIILCAVTPLTLGFFAAIGLMWHRKYGY